VVHVVVLPSLWNCRILAVPILWYVEGVLASLTHPFRFQDVIDDQHSQQPPVWEAVAFKPVQ